MGATQPPRLGSPLVALIFGRDELYAPTLTELEKLFGPRELESPTYPFDKTAYYEPEMGAGLKRRFVTFERLADPAQLADWKLATNALEERLAKEWDVGRGTRDEGLGENGRNPAVSSSPAPRPPSRAPRAINIDPGYITGAKLVLASTKDFAHRIYLHSGIFAEITLSFRGGAWVSHEYTFPDFRAQTYHAFLRRARDAHLRKVGPAAE